MTPGSQSARSSGRTRSRNCSWHGGHRHMTLVMAAAAFLAKLAADLRRSAFGSALGQSERNESGARASRLSRLKSLFPSVPVIRTPRQTLCLRLVALATKTPGHRLPRPLPTTTAAPSTTVVLVRPIWGDSWLLMLRCWRWCWHHHIRQPTLGLLPRGRGDDRLLRLREEPCGLPMATVLRPVGRPDRAAAGAISPDQIDGAWHAGEALRQRRPGRRGAGARR